MIFHADQRPKQRPTLGRRNTDTGGHRCRWTVGLVCELNKEGLFTIMKETTWSMMVGGRSIMMLHDCRGSQLHHEPSDKVSFQLLN